MNKETRLQIKKVGYLLGTKINEVKKEIKSLEIKCFVLFIVAIIVALAK